MRETRIYAKAAIVYNGKVLILRRSDDDDYLPGTADLPGGQIEPGEELLAGLNRELKEEIGQTVSANDLKLAYTYTSMKEGANFIRLYFVGWLTSESIRLSHEHNQMWWMTLDEAIVKNEHPLQNQFLRYVKDNQLLAQSDAVTLQ